MPNSSIVAPRSRSSVKPEGPWEWGVRHCNLLYNPPPPPPAPEPLQGTSKPAQRKYPLTPLGVPAKQFKYSSRDNIDEPMYPEPDKPQAQYMDQLAITDWQKIAHPHKRWTRGSG